jgi:prophage DNA circulation protein
MDGTIVEFDMLEVGQPLFVVTETETIPAPEGTHALSGDLEGVSVVVDANGIIVEIIDERTAAVAQTEEVPVEEQMSTEKVESIINAKLESFASSIEAVAEMMKVIADSNNNLSNEIATLKGEFETFKSAPTNNTNETEKFSKVGNLTAKQQWLKNNKNK